VKQPSHRIGRADERTRLLAFLQTIACPGADVDALPADANLFDAGIIDSLAVVRIIEYLESEYGIRFAGAGFDPLEIGTITGIERVIAGGR